MGAISPFEWNQTTTRMSSSGSLTPDNCTWGPSCYRTTTHCGKLQRRVLGPMHWEWTFLNNSFFGAKLCLVPSILGALVFFVLPKEKGNKSGSWASPQEGSLGLIKEPMGGSCGCSYVNQPWNNKKYSSGETGAQVSLSRWFPFTLAKHSLLCVLYKPPIWVCVFFKCV